MSGLLMSDVPMLPIAELKLRRLIDSKVFFRILCYRERIIS
jgi:hypothetical protein